MLKAQENTQQNGGTRADQAPGHNHNMKNYELATGKTFEELKTIIQNKTDTVVGDFNYIAKNSILVQKEQQTIQTNSVIKPENNNYFYKDQQLDIVPNFNLKLYQKLICYVEVKGTSVENPLIDTNYHSPQLQKLDFDNWDYSSYLYGISKTQDRVLKIDNIQLNKNLINNLNLCTPDSTYDFFYASKKNDDDIYITSTINDINSQYNRPKKYVNFFGHFTLETPGYEDDSGNVTSYYDNNTLSVVYSQAENNTENEFFYPVGTAADAYPYPGEQKYPQGLPIGRGIYMIPQNTTVGSMPSDYIWITPVFCFVLGIEKTPEV